MSLKRRLRVLGHRGTILSEKTIDTIASPIDSTKAAVIMTKAAIVNSAPVKFMTGVTLGFAIVSGAIHGAREAARK